MKGRWKSLTGLRLILTFKKKIPACVVLHNILINIHDEWSEEKRWWNTEEQEEHDDQLLDFNRRKQIEGTDKRKDVKHLVLNWLDS